MHRLEILMPGLDVAHLPDWHAFRQPISPRKVGRPLSADRPTPEKMISRGAFRLISENIVDGWLPRNRGLDWGVSKRLFVGLELPSNSRTMLAELDPQIKGVRWLAADQMHLSLSFLGEVEGEQEDKLRTALSDIRVPPFFLPTQGIGTFGGQRPAVIWAGVGKGHPHLFALHKHIQDAILQVSLEPDLRAFHPHITLGRCKSVSRQTLRSFLRRYQATEFDLWQVTGFALFSSVLSFDGAIHSVEKRFDFLRGKSWQRHQA